jgi:hypothetical protein
MQTRDQKKAQDEYKKVLGSSKPSLASNQSPHIPNTSDHTSQIKLDVLLLSQDIQTAIPTLASLIKSNRPIELNIDQIKSILLKANDYRFSILSNQIPLNINSKNPVLFDHQFQLFLSIELSFQQLSQNDQQSLLQTDVTIKKLSYLSKCSKAELKVFKLSESSDLL